MRIIAGSRKGHKLHDFDGMDIRPTTDRVKESIFNLIQEYIQDAECLDLFGGSGALGFEALSRGAKECTIVDIDQRSIDVIKKNSDSLALPGVSIVREDAMRYLEKTDKKFSVIFLDPPYNKGFIAPVIKAICERDILSDEGIVMLESDFSDEHSEFGGLEIIKQRKYGRSYVTVYQRV